MPMGIVRFLDVLNEIVWLVVVQTCYGRSMLKHSHDDNPQWFNTFEMG